MAEQDDQQKNNETANQIFLDIAQSVYSGLAGNGSPSISVTLEFDDMQRVINVKDLLVDGSASLPPPDMFAAINDKAAEILKLPEIYKIKSLFIEIKDGKANVEPTYLK